MNIINNIFNNKILLMSDIKHDKLNMIEMTKYNKIGNSSEF
jgi:hypothetical protein